MQRGQTDTNTGMARRRKRPTMVQLGSLPVRIDGPDNEEHGGSGDRQSSVVGWQENGWKEGRIAMGAWASPAMIAAMAVVMGGFKMSALMKLIHLGNWNGWRWFTGARKMA